MLLTPAASAAAASRFVAPRTAIRAALLARGGRSTRLTAISGSVAVPAGGGAAAQEARHHTGRPANRRGRGDRPRNGAGRGVVVVVAVAALPAGPWPWRNTASSRVPANHGRRAARGCTCATRRGSRFCPRLHGLQGANWSAPECSRRLHPLQHTAASSRHRTTPLLYSVRARTGSASI